MTVELRIPESGESIAEVQIGDWLKSEGQYVQQDEIVVEIETDKATMELPAPVSGTITEILKQSGEMVNVGDIIAYIDETAKAPENKSAENAGQQAGEQNKATPQARTEDQPPVAPSVRRILAEYGLQASQVAGSGPGGRILKEDVLRFVEGQPKPEQEEKITPPPMRQGEQRDEEVVPMTIFRQRVAERLIHAQQTAALLTTFNEIDMSHVIAMRTEYGETFKKKYTVKLGFMSFFVKAAIDALKLFPQVNARVRDKDIIYHNYYDIGIAVATDRGLAVPVLRNADCLSFAEIEIAIDDLAARARNKKLKLEELEGGTFTITNGGVFGSMLSTPIVNPPQSGILGLHAIQDRPVVADEKIVIRPMMYVALTYDHRIVDGREAVLFLKRIKESLETTGRMLIEV